MPRAATSRKASAKKSTAKKSTAKKSTAKKSTAKKSTSKKSTAKKSTSKKSTSRKSTARPLAASARVSNAVARIVTWLREHAPAALDNLRLPARDRSAVEAALGRPLPAELAAFWRVHGGGLPIFEYTSLSPSESLRRRAGLERLREAGTFDAHELFEQDVPRIQPVKWHPGWLPLAEDGGGNMYCVDLAPGPEGQVGQIIRWEVRGGPFADSSRTLADVLERYAKVLPRFTYDIDAGTFDGPFVDLLAR